MGGVERGGGWVRCERRGMGGVEGGGGTVGGRGMGAVRKETERWEGGDGRDDIGRGLGGGGGRGRLRPGRAYTA